MALADSLERARARVEAKLLDPTDPLTTVTIVADPEAFGDDTFDTDTGTWTRPPSDATTVYAGPGLVRDESSSEVDDAGTRVTESRWVGKIPLSADGVLEGNVLRVETSRDPECVGRKFRVTEVHGGTFKMLKKLSLIELRADVTGWADRV